MDTNDRRHLPPTVDAPLFRYGVTVAAVAAAALARWLLDPLLGDDNPYATFYAAVALAAWVGGLRTGLLATVLGGVLALGLLVPPRYSFTPPSGPHLVGLVMYVLVAAAIAAFGEAMRRSRRREAEQRERLRTTLASIGDAVITTDTAGRVTHLNAVAEGLTGWAVAEAAGVPLAEVFRIVHETTRRQVENPAFRAIREGVIVGLANHTVLIARDGTERAIEDSAAPIRCKAGEVVGCVLVFRDVSERRRAEVEREAAQQQVASTLESITDGFMRFDADWRVVYVNAEAERISGQPRGELLGRTHWELFPLTVGTPLEGEYRRAVAEGVTVEFENFYEPLGRWFAVKGFPTADGGLAVYFQDVTARKRAEAELRRQTATLQAITDTTADLIYVKDRAGRLTFANPATLAVLGRAEGEVVGADPRTLYADPAQAEAIRAIDERVMASGTTETVEEWFTGPLGTRTYLSTKTPLRDAGGAVVGLVGISQDITARQRAEAELAGSEARYRMATDAVAGVVYECDLTTLRVERSSGLLALLGYRPDEAEPTARWWGERVHPDDMTRLDRMFKTSTAAGATTQDAEYRVRHRDGSYRHVWDRAVLERDECGRLTRMVGCTIDITARKRAEEQLRERERFVQRVLDASPGVVYVFDLGGGQTAFINERVRHALGVSPEEVIAAGDRFWAERVHPDDRDALAAHVAGLTDLADGGVREVEYRVRHADGRWVWFLSRDTVFQRTADGPPRQVLGVASDVTARREAEAAVRASEERYRTLFETMDQGFCVLEVEFDGAGRAADYRVVEMNPAFVKHTGTRGLVGRSVRQALPDLEEFWFETYGRVAATGEPARFAQQAGPMGGRWFEVYAFRPGDAGANRVAVLFTDVSDRKRAERALQDSEAHFRSMADNAPVKLWVTDPTGACVYLSRRWYEFTGRTPEQDLGFGWLENTHPDDRERAAAVFQDANARRVPFTLDYRLRRHDGEYRWAVDAAQPRFEGGEFRGFVGSVTDVHERRVAEEGRREAEGRYRTLFEAMDEGFCVIEFFDGPHGPLSDYLHVLANPAYTANAGLPDIVGREVRETVPDEADGWVETFRDVLLTGRPVRFERELVATGRHLELAAFRIEPADRRQVAVLFKDVTARKRAEEALREADRRKDEFLATLAHELRNPLAPIRNGLRVLRTVGGGEQAELTRTMMDRQLTQLVRLVDDLLDVSRITRGKLDLRRERIDLRAVIDAAVETARPPVEQAGHALTLDVPAEPMPVDGDHTRLAQVVSNLLTNAAKYTRPGGHIRLTARRDGGAAVVAVADDGIGIPPAMLGRVFDMFTQVDRTLEKTTGGLGIGLSLVKGLVDMHGGTVEARSDGEGQGSEFVVRLPALAEAAPAPPPPNGRADDPPPAGRRILVVDDNADSADSMGQLLELLGNEVRTAYDGEAGVAAAGEFRPGVVLMDIGMPRLNGYDAARRIRAEAWGAKMVLVALTGWGQEDDRAKSAAAGFDHHLVKPVDTAVLLRLLAEATN